jgi:predicted amidohydrolase
MARKIVVAAAQLGAVHLTTPRKAMLDRMIALLEEAVSKGAQLVVYPETAFTTFFPRFLFKDDAELDSFFEHGADLPKSPNMAPLFEKVSQLKVDIQVGFAERTPEGKSFNTAVYYSGELKKIISKYRKIHLPGTVEPFEDPDAVNQLEKRYFEPGDLGFEAFRAPGLLAGVLKQEDVGGRPSRELEGKGDPILGMMICNDRRWPESWRCLALQGCELVLCGYNTAGYAPELFNSLKQSTLEEAEKESIYHHKLVMKANSYMNSCFSVSAARAGMDDGKYLLIGASCITSSEGHVLAEATGKDDEVVIAEIDLEEARQGKTKVGWPTTILKTKSSKLTGPKLFDFHRHRRPEAYTIISSQTGVVEPAFLSREEST